MSHFRDERCALCPRPKWHHILPPSVRRQQDQHDDGHAFRPIAGLDGKQLQLPFRQSIKPPARVAAVAATQAGPGKKPPHSAAEIAQKKGKQRVA